MEYLNKVLESKGLWICRNGAAPKKDKGRNTSIGADASTAFI